ncbi:hypothetical protein Pse7367_0152 [Thalassoporum mexicanum PCC 7367]|uniref:hypothetical protein n=1 Tax=Thalassoporum mexicanum TaxID=3457544 RepID=UPI00029FA1D4|nr:hypothetical protein [Pseudanabaena sp. PCC 7367]AFY68469.1 hypothetical protein Pse7367_0152 [Pseudanabaena sp. PCC 7367]
MKTIFDTLFNLVAFFLFIYLFSQMWRLYIRAQPPIVEGARYELERVGADRYVADEIGLVYVVKEGCTGVGQARDLGSSLVFRNTTCEIVAVEVTPSAE